MDKSAIYREIRESINSGAITTMPKEKLAEYAAALARPQAYSHYGASEFTQKCETVRALLLASSIGESSGQNVAPDETTTTPDGRTNPRETTLKKIAIDVIIIVLGAMVIWIFHYYLGLLL